MTDINIDLLVNNLRSEDYFNQRPHHDFFNRIFYSRAWKKWAPFHEKRDLTILERQRGSEMFGAAPQGTWVDGVLDYTYNKHNITSIGHFHMHENRKNKPQKDKRIGGDATNKQLLYPEYAVIPFPKGCQKEIRKFNNCDKNGNSDCTKEKIDVIEICPKWCVEKLREAKKQLLKETVIDNNTYRKAMNIEDYNKGRTLRDLKDKNAHLRKIRPDGYYADDRYNPVFYPSADNNTNTNLGEDIIFNDVLGGNRVEYINEERKKYMEKL